MQIKKLHYNLQAEKALEAVLLQRLQAEGLQAAEAERKTNKKWR